MIASQSNKSSYITLVVLLRVKKVCSDENDHQCHTHHDGNSIHDDGGDVAAKSHLSAGPSLVIVTARFVVVRLKQ